MFPLRIYGHKGKPFISMGLKKSWVPAAITFNESGAFQTLSELNIKVSSKLLRNNSLPPPSAAKNLQRELLAQFL